jgi:hypothetical protein
MRVPRSAIAAHGDCPMRVPRSVSAANASGDTADEWRIRRNTLRNIKQQSVTFATACMTMQSTGYECNSRVHCRMLIADSI